jgi:hypothetical protein
MANPRSFPIFIALVALAAGSVAHGEIIPADRRINWSPGVPGGLPHYPVQYDVKVDFGAVGDGVADDTLAIASALAAATPGHAVYVPEGTYRVTGTLHIGTGVAIRGAGPTHTLIYSHHGQTTFSIAGSAPVAVTTLSAAASKDAQAVDVASTSGLSAGDLVQLKRPDDVSQTLEVAEVSGSRLVFSGVLYSDFPSGSSVARHSMVYDAGVEDLKILIDWPALDGYVGTQHVYLGWAARSWVRNIEAEGYCGHAVLVESSYQCEVRDSYFHHDVAAALAQSSFKAYGVELSWATSDSLVENNVFNIFRHAMVIQYDNAGGNVFGYNMSWDSYTTDDTTGVTSRTNGIGDIEFHHQQVEQALFEGNHAECVRLIEGDFPDLTYDKNNNTLLRNRITQAGIKTGEGNNFVGNELPYRKYADTSGEWYPENDFNASPNTLLHGNYVVFDDQGLSWDPLILDHDIPASYYLSEKPVWFGDLQWPPFGGDLMPNNARRSPAEVRFWTMQFPEVAPSDLTLTVQGSEVHLSWTNNSSNTVDFVVVRSTDGSYFERIADTTATTYVDGGLAPGETRWYYVRARNHLGGENGDQLGGESDPSGTVSTPSVALQLSLADCAVSEGNAGPSTCTFEVVLQGAP